MFTGIKHWDLITMSVLMGLIFIFEMMGVFSPRLVTITQITKDFVPMPCRWLIIGWVFWHFIGSDLWPHYVRGN